MTIAADRGVLITAEQVARRIFQLTTMPMRSERHPTWDPEWRKVMEEGLSSIGLGDEQRMDRALRALNRIALGGLHQLPPEQYDDGRVTVL